MLVTIYHNQRCSKSRAALEILNQNPEAKITIVDYLQNPPSVATLQTLAKLMDIGAQEMMRHKEQVYQALNLSSGAHSEAALFQIMHENPQLIERPIVVINNQKAVIARPPELVLSVL